ncbi:hypothetical protein B566_EDAN008927 [Ephemera danica]|nr:hypothetical protein B566_EDAN008927 [Ephemera danica]
MAAPSECHASQDEGDKKVPPKILPCEDINDWDPMEDAFNDPNFNQYTHGPAKYTPESKVQASCPRRLGPGLENYSEVYRVFISKPPSDLDEDGIFLLASRVDARKMIEGLHKVPPMNLDVQFGFSDEEKARHARERNEKRRFEEEEAGRKIREPVNEMLSTIPDAQPVGMEKFPGDENRDKVLKVGGRGLPLNPPCRLTSWPQEPRAGGLSQHAAATVNLNELLDPLHQSSELDYFGQYAGGYNDDATAVISKAVDKLQRDYHPVNSRSRNFGGRGYYMPNRASERKPGGLRHSAGRAYNPVQHMGLSNPKNEAATKPVPVQNTPVQDQSSVVDKQQQTDKPSQSANTTTVPVQTSQAKSVQDPPPESKHAAAKQGNTSAQKSQPSSQLKQTEAPQSEQKGLHQATPKQVNTAKSQPSSPKPPGKTFASSLKNQTTPPLNFYRMHPGPHNTVPFKPSLPNPNKSWASTLKSQPESTSPQAKANSGNLEPSNFPPPQQQQQSPQTPPSRDQPDFSIPPPNMSPKPATPTQNIPPYPHAISPNNVARANPMPQHNIVQNSMVQSNNVQNQVSPGSVSQNPMAQRNALQHSIAQHSSVQGPVAQDSPVQNPMAQRNSMQGPMAQQNTMKYPVVQSNPVQNPVAQQNMIQNPMAQNSVQNSVAHNNPMQKQMGSGNVTFNPMMPSHAPYNQIGPGNIAQNQMVPGNIAQNQMMPGNIAQNQMMPGNAMHNHMGRGNLMHGHMAPASNIVHGQMGPGNNMSAVNLMPNQMGPGNFAQNFIGQGNPLHSNIHPGNPVHNMTPGNPVHSQMGPGNVPHNHMNPMQQHMAQQAVAAHHNMQQQVPNYTAQTAPYRSPSVSPHKPTVAMHPRGCQQQMNFPRNPAAQTQEKIPNIPPFPAQFQNPDYYTQRRSKGPRYPQQQRTNWRNNYQNKQWPSKPHRYDRNPTPPFNAESTSASQQQSRLTESAPAPVMESNTPVAQTSSTASKDQSKPPTPVPQTSHTTSPPAPVITKPIAATDTAPSSAARDSAPPIADSANPPAMTSSQPPSKTVESQEPVLPEKEVEATVKVPEAKTEETKDDLSIRRLLESIATSNPKASSSETPDIPEVSSVEASMVAKQLREEETELACESVQGNSPDKIKTAEISSPDACKPLQSAAAIQNPEAPKCVEDETTTCVQDTDETDEDGSVPESSENQAAAARDTQETATSSEQNKVRVKAATENTGDTKSYEKPPRHQNPPSNQQHRHRQTRQRSYAYPEQQQQQQQMYPHMCLIPVTQPQQPPVVYSPEYNTFVVMSPVPQEQEYPSASGTPDYDGSNFYPVEEYYESPVQYYYPQASQEQEYYASESEASSTDQYVPANAPQYSTITSPPMYYPSPSPEVGNEYSDQESEGAVYMEPVYQMQYPNQQVVYVAPSYAPKEPEQQYVQYPAQVMYQPGYPPQQMVPMVPQYYNTVYQQPMMIPGPMPPPSPSPQAYAPQMPSPQPYVPQMPSSQAFVPHQIHPPQAFAPQMQAQQSYVPQNPPAFVPAAVQPQYRILPRPSGAGIVLPPHLVSDKQMQ